MFVLIAFGAGATLYVQAIWKEVRNLKLDAEQSGGLGIRQTQRIGLKIHAKGVLLILVPILVGYGLDILTGTPISRLIE